MTQYELWTMSAERLVSGYTGACFAAAAGRKPAEKAMEVARGEIMRRLRLLEQMEEDMDDFREDDE